MDIKLLQEVINMVEKANISSFEVSEGDLCIKIDKNKRETKSTGNSPVDVFVKENIQEKNETKTADLENKNVVQIKSDLKEIKSPMIGVYYSASSPESDPFVSVGKKVKKGDVVCIIEAMKLMNEICAEEDGIIEEICVENEQVVEFGQVLFKFK